MRSRREGFGLMALLAGLVVVCGCHHGSSIEPDAGTGDAAAGRACRQLPAGERNGAGPVPVLSDPAFATRPPNWGVDPAQVTVTTLVVGGRTLHVLRFPVTTFDQRFGRPWVHPVVVIAPDPTNLVGTDVAAFGAALGETMNPVGPGDDDPTWGTLHPDWFAGTDTQEHDLQTFGSVAVERGIPYVAAEVVPAEIQLDVALVADIQALLAANSDPCDDGECAGPITADDQKMACLIRAVFAREDLAYDPYINLAVAQARIIDAAERVLAGYYEALGAPVPLEWTRVWTIGSSKRGHTQRFAAAVDARIAGVMVSAADISNLTRFASWELALWTGAYSFGMDSLAALMATPFGQTYRAAVDPFAWRPEVLHGVFFVLAVGTRDPLYPLGACLGYVETLPPDRRLLLVPNYGHGRGTVDHAAVFRALVDHGLNGTSWPTVDARWDVDRNVVQAAVVGGEAAAVELWCTTGLAANDRVIDTLPDCSLAAMPAADDTDLRDATWERFPMTARGGGQWEATPPATALSYPACLVRAHTADEQVATSVPLFSAPLCAAYDLPLE
ncbi:MAG: hypothetical protein HY906_26310 [Deltaproteobacteria bacterium]|nr:hypothetical protein [Deltaproteobacteria bacterium]